MKRYIFVIVLFALCPFFTPAQVHVTFRVNMAAKVYNQLWDPATDSVAIRGSFQADAGDPNGDWTGFYYKMSLIQDTVYAVTVTFPSSKIGNLYDYKYVIGPDSWEGASNRLFTCPTKDSVLSIYWFADDSSHVANKLVTNTVTFKANISSFLGAGSSYLDSTKDSLLVDGLDWNGHGTLVSGNRKMTANNSVAGEYSTTLRIAGVLGDSCEWKFHAYPVCDFNNSGYETGSNRWYVFQADESVVNIPVIVPRFGGFSDISIDENVPNSTKLSQNYPNPFNPSTRIEYTVPATGLVSLKIFDLLGREVTTLVNKERTAGSYSVDFNAAHLTSGIYFYKLTAGSNSIVKKMLLLK